MGDKALGRSRGRLTTKIHLPVNELGLPLEFLITAGQSNDYTPCNRKLVRRSASHTGMKAEAMMERSLEKAR